MPIEKDRTKQAHFLPIIVRQGETEQVRILFSHYITQDRLSVNDIMKSNGIRMDFMLDGTWRNKVFELGYIGFRDKFRGDHIKIPEEGFAPFFYTYHRPMIIKGRAPGRREYKEDFKPPNVRVKVNSEGVDARASAAKQLVWFFDLDLLNVARAPMYLKGIKKAENWPFVVELKNGILSDEEVPAEIYLAEDISWSALIKKDDYLKSLSVEKNILIPKKKPRRVCVIVVMHPKQGNAFQLNVHLLFSDDFTYSLERAFQVRQSAQQ